MNDKQSHVFFMEDPAVSLTLLSESPPLIEKRMLHVTSRERISYTLYSTNPDEEGEWVNPKQIDKEQIYAFCKRIDDIFKEVINNINKVIKQEFSIQQEWEDIFLNLQGIGQKLFTELIPVQIAERVKKWQSGSYLRISTDETWIPWELIYDGLDFWGNRFILTRYPRLSDRRTIPTKNRPISSGFKKIRRIVNVVGGEIPESQAQRASKLFDNLFSSVPVEILQAQPVSILAKALSGADTLHFTCHGYLEPHHMLQIAGDKSLIHNLCLDTVESLSVEPGSLVFANACSSNVPVPTLWGLNNFGWEFYKIGADVFIGTIGTVPTQYAVLFAENFYRELSSENPKSTVGEAIVKAKAITKVVKAKETTKKDYNGLFSLLYCVYGNPNF